MGKIGKWLCGCPLVLGSCGCTECNRCNKHCICGVFPSATRAPGDTGKVETIKCLQCGHEHICAS